jgi:hypothetical protein
MSKDTGQVSYYPFVIPAKAGIHGAAPVAAEAWIPAFAGMTVVNARDQGSLLQPARDETVLYRLCLY